jgi:hydroxysqualene dehydroxylase
MSGRVVVIGGGLAGIAAAAACARGGVETTLLEARPHLGGATFTVERDGLPMDNGQHVFLRCCTEYLALLEWLGSAHLTRLQPRLEIPVLAPDGRRATLARSGLPAPLHLARSLAGYGHLTLWERARVAPAMLAMRRLDPADPALDTQLLGDWLAARGQSDGAIDRLWDVIVRPTLNIPTREASLALAVKVFRTGLLDRADACDVGWPAVPLAQLHGEPAARALAAAGVRVRSATRTTGVASTPTGVVVRLAEGELEADAAIVCVPPDRVAELLPAGALPDVERLPGLGAAAIVNLHVVYDRPVTDLEISAAVDSPVQWVFDRTASAGLGGGAQYLAVSLSAADDYLALTQAELRELFLPALARLFPAARSATVERFFAIREQRATFRSTPGTAALRPGPRTAAHGLYLAGAWTSTGWPATMESAVRSGNAAAACALDDLAGSAAGPEAVAA